MNTAQKQRLVEVKEMLLQAADAIYDLTRDDRGDLTPDERSALDRSIDDVWLIRRTIRVMVDED